MSIFDLLLIAVVLASCLTLFIALVHAVRGKFPQARRALAYLGAGLGVYFFALFTVSLTAHQKIAELGEPQCSDDWCVTPTRAVRNGNTVEVEFTVRSRALRVTQREFGVNPYLVDAQGNRVFAAETVGPRFDQEVSAGESYNTIRRYRVSPGTGSLDLILRPNSGIGPGQFVIGDEASLLHPRTVVRVP
jgi:hypothetical protein